MRFPIPFWFRRFALFYTYYFALDLLPSSNDDHLHRHAHTSRPPQRIRVAHGDISIKPEPSEPSSPIYHTVTVVTIHPISDRRTATGVLYANRARNHGELGDVTLHLSVYLRRPGASHSSPFCCLAILRYPFCQPQSVVASVSPPLQASTNPAPIMEAIVLGPADHFPRRHLRRVRSFASHLSVTLNPPM